MNEEEKIFKETCEVATEVSFTWERGCYIENDINDDYRG